MKQYAGTKWSDIDRVDELRPSPLKAYEDRPVISPAACVVNRDVDDFQACEFGSEDAEHTVVLVGDSKAIQWFTPVRRLAERQNWRLVLIAKNGCSFADVVRLVDDKRNPSCDDWSPHALDTIEQMKPDVVITTTRWQDALPEGGTSEDDYQVDAMVDGLVTYWEKVISTGVVLVPLLDTPGPLNGDAPGCVQEHQTDLSKCSYRLAPSNAKSGAVAARKAAKQVPEARVVDMTPTVCPDGDRCPAVIGNVLVYRRGSHLSNTFAATSTDALGKALAEATDGLFGSAPASN